MGTLPRDLFCFILDCGFPTDVRKRNVADIQNFNAALFREIRVFRLIQKQFRDWVDFWMKENMTLVVVLENGKMFGLPSFIDFDQAKKVCLLFFGNMQHFTVKSEQIETLIFGFCRYNEPNIILKFPNLKSFTFCAFRYTDVCKFFQYLNQYDVDADQEGFGSEERLIPYAAEIRRRIDKSLQWLEKFSENFFCSGSKLRYFQTKTMLTPDITNRILSQVSCVEGGPWKFSGLNGAEWKNLRILDTPVMLQDISVVCKIPYLESLEIDDPIISEADALPLTQLKHLKKLVIGGFVSQFEYQTTDVSLRENMFNILMKLCGVGTSSIISKSAVNHSNDLYYQTVVDQSASMMDSVHPIFPLLKEKLQQVPKIPAPNVWIIFQRLGLMPDLLVVKMENNTGANTSQLHHKTICSIVERTYIWDLSLLKRQNIPLLDWNVFE